MSVERQLIAERERAHLAKQIIDNPVWQQAWQAWEDGVMSAWRQSDPDDWKRRENLWAEFRAGSRVRSEIERAIQTGVMAEMTLAEGSRKNGR